MFIPWWVLLIIASLLLYALSRFDSVRNLEERVKKLESRIGDFELREDEEEGEIYEA